MKAVLVANSVSEMPAISASPNASFTSPISERSVASVAESRVNAMAFTLDAASDKLVEETPMDSARCSSATNLVTTSPLTELLLGSSVDNMLSRVREHVPCALAFTAVNSGTLSGKPACLAKATARSSSGIESVQLWGSCTASRSMVMAEAILTYLRGILIPSLSEKAAMRSTKLTSSLPASWSFVSKVCLAEMRPSPWNLRLVAKLMD
mmetsp:Transcript_90607/g.287044  ORF Transcript_90607/g.287044 Transcript_90607/m.287044 type:complete len:209 (-) Transcript_90607:287-913(-)